MKLIQLNNEAESETLVMNWIVNSIKTMVGNAHVQQVIKAHASSGRKFLATVALNNKTYWLSLTKKMC